RLAARVRKAFGRDVPLERFLAAPTVAGLATVVADALREGELPARPPVERAARPQPRPDGAVEVPTSLGQRRMWLVDRLAPGGIDYNVVWPLRLVGRLDVPALRAALTAVVERHDVLRSRFVATVTDAGEEPVALVDPAGEVPLPLRDLVALPAQARAREVAGVVARHTTTPFDLTAGPLLRAELLRVTGAEHVLVLSAHHSVWDGWSASILLRELSALYSGGELGPLPVRYSDYAAWERAWLSGPVLTEQVEYWRRTLGGAPDTMELPTDLPRPTHRSGEGARLPFELSAELATGLAALCRGENATLFMGLLAAFSALVGRYARTDDVLVGTFSSNRSQPELEELVGFFVNTLVLRTDVSGEPTFRELVARARTTALGAFAHQDLPFDRVVEELHPRRQPGSVPWLQAALVMQNMPEEGGELGDLVVESLPTDTRTATFDVAMYTWRDEQGRGIGGYLEYATDLFTPATMERLAGHFRAFLEQAVREPDAPISRLGMLTRRELHDLRAATGEVAGPVRLLGGARTLLAAFDRQAAATPDRVAFRDGEGTEALSYAELDRRSRLLAARLTGLGVGLESPVGVCLPRGVDLPVALLAVLRAGGAYLPLDPDNPTDRLRHMLADSGAEAVITRDPTVAGLVPGLPLVGPDVPPGPARPTGGPATVDAENIAAVIYTSGSTGRPKGVALTHRSLLNRIGWMWAETPPVEDETCCLKTPIGFVDSLWELLGPLLVGVPTVVPSAPPRDPVALVAELARHGVTRLLLVPSLLRMLLQAVPDLATRLPRLRLWVSSGEPLLPDLHRLFTERMPGHALHNLYGASEVWDALWPADGGADVRDGRPVPVGRPIANVTAHLLDQHLNPVPVGVVGELYVGGDCLARGYLHRPELTAERFVPHPDPQAGPGARLYRTGDLGRRRDDGQVELLGRADNQVKVRGFRVEPGEVETALESLPQIKQAAVRGWLTEDTDAATGGPGDSVLAAYVVAGDGTTASDLRAALSDLLPSHLVPSSFTFMPELPLTSTGKVDRRALPPPVAAEAGAGEAETELERVLALLWADVLERDRVGMDDDFFDIGGHSLLAPVLVARVGEALGREVPVRAVFEHPTVRTMAAALGGTDGPTDGSEA
ncbi:MAG TPA: amino acid adenylation domain-containing protein, partial [Pseudonocardiaceae bacterium]